MKKQIKLLLGLITLSICALPFGVNAATVDTEAALVAALANDAEVTLGGNIEITAPISTNKDVVLNGNGYTIKATYARGAGGSTENSTIITSTNGTLTLKNITLDNSPKYGAQAYENGKVVLDGVTVTNSAYGALLINGGTLTIKDLTMNDNAYGIEFAVGAVVTGTPTLIMDGQINGSQANKLYVDVDQVEELVVKNTATTVQTISLDNNKLVLAKDGTVIAQSNELTTAGGDKINADVTSDKQEVTEQPATPTVKTEAPKNEVNPKTADTILLVTLALIASLVAMVFAKKKIRA